MKWDYEGEYLNQFDKNYRGTIGDRFCRAVREGCDDVQSILGWVYHDTISRENPVWQLVATSCLKGGDAWDFAQHILDRESLSWEERQTLKESRDKNPTWTDDPPTEKQLNYLKRLGYLAPVKTKGEASSLISSFKASVEPVQINIDPDSLPF